MLEMGMSGLMSGEGKRARADALGTAPFLTLRPVAGGTADALVVPDFILHEVTDDERFTGG